LIEIDITSECPKEIDICRENGDIINIVVEHSWLPPKCSICGGFGHAAYACVKKDKKEKKVWIPKVQRKEPLRNTSPQTKQKLSFDRTIRKPVRASTSKEKSGGIRLSNSFERLAKEDKENEEVQSRQPMTFMDVFENALSSKGKGKAKVGKGSLDVRGFSPIQVL
jgi:hypothetical protein